MQGSKHNITNFLIMNCIFILCEKSASKENQRIDGSLAQYITLPLTIPYDTWLLVRFTVFCSVMLCFVMLYVVGKFPVGI